MPIRQQATLLFLNPASYGFWSASWEHMKVWEAKDPLFGVTTSIIYPQQCWIKTFFWWKAPAGALQTFLVPVLKNEIKQPTTFLRDEFTCAVLPSELCWLPDCSHIRQGPVDILGLVGFLPNQALWNGANVLYG